MIKQPSRGQLSDLWNLLEPNRGYSSKEIEKIAQEHQLKKYTASNLMSHGIKQKYLYLYESRYYRSDSTIVPNVVIFENQVESNIEAEFKMAEKILLNSPERYYRDRQRKEEIIKQKEELECEEKILDSRIAEFEACFQVLAESSQQISKTSQ